MFNAFDALGWISSKLGTKAAFINMFKNLVKQSSDFGPICFISVHLEIAFHKNTCFKNQIALIGYTL